MKFIGQFIQYFTSRFKNDVFLDDISTGTIASGAHLGLDSNNKIVKAVDGGGDLTGITAGTGLSGTDLTGPVPTLNVDASIPEITTLAGLTSIGAAGATTDFAAGDITMYNAVNNGNPTISLGSSATERLEIKAEYETGAQGLDVVRFTSFTAGSATDDARYAFEVDDAFLIAILDGGLRIKASGNLEIGSGNTILSDSSGTTTLSNIDALDATTIATFETAMEANIDTFGSQMTSASSLATVGTITTGVWRGTSINVAYTDAKVTSIVAGDGIDVSGATGDVTVTAETATDSNPGVVELATTAEAVTGTDTARAVTPAGLAARVSQIVNLKGYVTLQNDVYDYANPYNSDDEAPFQLDTDYGSGTIGSSTEKTQASFMRSGGFHVPFACTVSALQVQASVNGSGGGNVTAALVEYRPSTASGDQNDYPRTVYEEVNVAANNNNNKIATTTIAAGDLDATAIPAGSHLMIMVKGDSDTVGDLAIVSMSVGLSW